MLTFLDRISGNVVGVRVTGKMTHADYERVIAKFEEVIQARGKVSVFFELEDCQGWEIGAIWDDLKFGLKHHCDFERCAVIGGKKWHKWMTKLSEVFFNVRYFEVPHFKDAWEWVTEGSEAGVTKV
jgi:hypothetical protein